MLRKLTTFPSAPHRYLPVRRFVIANSRLVIMIDTYVAFRWKDYRHHGQSKVVTLTADEFIRRHLEHTPPDPS